MTAEGPQRCPKCHRIVFWYDDPKEDSVKCMECGYQCGSTRPQNTYPSEENTANSYATKFSRATQQERGTMTSLALWVDVIDS